MGFRKWGNNGRLLPHSNCPQTSIVRALFPILPSCTTTGSEGRKKAVARPANPEPGFSGARALSGSPAHLPERAAPGLRRVGCRDRRRPILPSGQHRPRSRFTGSPGARSRPPPLGAVVQVPRLPPLHLAPVTDGASRRPQGRGQRLAFAPLRDAPAWTLGGGRPGAGFLPPLTFPPGLRRPPFDRHDANRTCNPGPCRQSLREVI